MQSGYATGSGGEVLGVMDGSRVLVLECVGEIDEVIVSDCEGVRVEVSVDVEEVETVTDDVVETEDVKDAEYELDTVTILLFDSDIIRVSIIWPERFSVSVSVFVSASVSVSSSMVDWA